MNILEQFKKAKEERDARMAETKYGVITTGELAVGETFEFGTTDELRLGDILDLRAWHRFPWPSYGKARITNLLAGGFYEATRTQ